MQIQKITAALLTVAAGLALAQSGTASATTVNMNLSWQDTALTGRTGTGAGTSFSSLPVTGIYGDSYNAAQADLAQTPGFSFYDDFVFTVSTATADSVTSEINLNKLSLTNLEERVYSITGNSPLPVLGTPQGFATQWTASVPFAAGPETGMFTVMDPTTLTAGTYVLEIRGEVTGANGGSYTGQLNLSPVPLPAALPLVLSGLALLGGSVRKRFV
ncbi:MAG TPA: FxDxF family PEP-CTERM protein [Steroidobacteraceae bacterium]